MALVADDVPALAKEASCHVLVHVREEDEGAGRPGVSRLEGRHARSASASAERWLDAATSSRHCLDAPPDATKVRERPFCARLASPESPALPGGRQHFCIPTFRANDRAILRRDGWQQL